MLNFIKQYIIETIYLKRWYLRYSLRVCKTCKRPFSSCPKPLFQSEAMCEATYMKMRFFSSCTEIKHFNRALPFVQSERPAPSRRNENFTFNQNYPARSVKYWIVCTKKMVFPQKLLKRPFHFQTDWSGNGPAGKFWQMDWALLASFWKREFLELGNCLWFHSFIMKTTATDISKDNFFQEVLCFECVKGK